jgi:hypothetical protein
MTIADDINSMGSYLAADVTAAITTAQNMIGSTNDTATTLLAVRILDRKRDSVLARADASIRPIDITELITPEIYDMLSQTTETNIFVIGNKPPDIDDSDTPNWFRGEDLT